MEYTMAELVKHVEEAGYTAWSALLNPRTGKYRLYVGKQADALEAVRLDLFTTQAQFRAALALGLKISEKELEEMSK